MPPWLKHEIQIAIVSKRLYITISKICELLFFQVYTFLLVYFDCSLDFHNNRLKLLGNEVEAFWGMCSVMFAHLCFQPGELTEWIVSQYFSCQHGIDIPENLMLEIWSWEVVLDHINCDPWRVTEIVHRFCSQWEFNYSQMPYSHCLRLCMFRKLRSQNKIRWKWVLMPKWVI